MIILNICCPHAEIEVVPHASMFFLYLDHYDVALVHGLIAVHDSGSHVSKMRAITRRKKRYTARGRASSQEI